MIFLRGESNKIGREEEREVLLKSLLNSINSGLNKEFGARTGIEWMRDDGKNMSGFIFNQ